MKQYLISEEELSIFLRLSAVRQKETNLTFKEIATNFLKNKQSVENVELEKENAELKKENYVMNGLLNGKEKEIVQKLQKLQDMQDECDTCLKQDFELNKLTVENENLKSKLANQKYLDRQEVEKIVGNNVFFDEDGDVTEAYPEDIITAICNLVLPEIDKNKITAILVGKILESDKDAVKIADEIISAIGGK